MHEQISTEIQECIHDSKLYSSYVILDRPQYQHVQLLIRRNDPGTFLSKQLFVQSRSCRRKTATQFVKFASEISSNGSLPVSPSHLRSSVGHHIQDHADISINHPAIPQASDFRFIVRVGFITSALRPPLLVCAVATIRYAQLAP